MNGPVPTDPVEAHAGDDATGAGPAPRPRQLLLRGFAPLVAAVVLAVLVVLLIPSVAPERVIEVDRPAGPTASSGPTSTREPATASSVAPVVEPAP